MNLKSATRWVADVRRFPANIRDIQRRLFHISRSIESQSVLFGRLLSDNLQEITQIANLHQIEFSVFSQWGDDGIIQYLISRIDLPTDTFIEFGVADYKESTTRFLLSNNNWTGIVFDSSNENIAAIRDADYYWRHNLTAKKVLVTRENINDELAALVKVENIGLLHIDIDGNDYWVWDAIQAIDPIIVIIEYNSVFGSNLSITVPYRPDFDRYKAHYSGLYFGASLRALTDLAEVKDYKFIGSNSAGNNAYFVKSSYWNESLPNPSPTDGYVQSKFRESRDSSFQNTYVGESDRLPLLHGLPVINTRTNVTEYL